MSGASSLVWKVCRYQEEEFSTFTPSSEPIWVNNYSKFQFKTKQNSFIYSKIIFSDTFKVADDIVFSAGLISSMKYSSIIPGEERGNREFIWVEWSFLDVFCGLELSYRDRTRGRTTEVVTTSSSSFQTSTMAWKDNLIFPYISGSMAWIRRGSAVGQIPVQELC